MVCVCIVITMFALLENMVGGLLDTLKTYGIEISRALRGSVPEAEFVSLSELNPAADGWARTANGSFVIVKRLFKFNAPFTRRSRRLPASRGH